MKSLLSGEHFLHYMAIATKGQVTLIWIVRYALFELVQDVLAILITCKSDKGSIKN